MMEEYNKSVMPSNFLVIHCYVPLPCFKLSSQIIILQRFAIICTFSNQMAFKSIYIYICTQNIVHLIWSNEKREKSFSLIGLPGACLQSSNSNNPPEDTWAASGNKLSNIL